MNPLSFSLEGSDLCTWGISVKGSVHRTDGRTDGRTPDRYVDPAVRPMRAASTVKSYSKFVYALTIYLAVFDQFVVL